MNIRIVTRALVAVAFGLAALSAYATVGDASKQPNLATMPEVYGARIPLVKYLNEFYKGMAAGLERPPANEPRTQLIRATPTEVYGTRVTLAKYKQNDQVCQQYIAQAGTTAGPAYFKLDEICGPPELRMVDGKEELFPANLYVVDMAVYTGRKAGMPMFGVMRRDASPNPAQP